MLFWIIKVVATPFLWLYFKPKVVGGKNKKFKGRMLIICNHKSFWDPVFLDVIFWTRRIIFMAKSELYKNGFIRWALTMLGGFEVKRDTHDLSAIKYAMKVLDEDKVLGIFPEGTRSKTGEILRFNPGAATIALRMSAPVLPVYIGGSYSLFRRAKIAIGEPIDLKQFCAGDRPSATEIQDICEMLRQRVLLLAKQV